jgi:hypothetical protein
LGWNDSGNPTFIGNWLGYAFGTLRERSLNPTYEFRKINNQN